MPEATGTEMPACTDVQAARVGGVHGLGVVSPSGKVAGSPAFFQSIARLELRMLDQEGCAWARVEANNDTQNKANGNRRKWFIRACLNVKVSPVY